MLVEQARNHAGAGKSTVESPSEKSAITPAVKACSACAGDYEDPDRTAWTEDDHQDSGDSGGEGEFPDEEE